MDDVVRAFQELRQILCFSDIGFDDFNVIFERLDILVLAG